MEHRVFIEICQSKEHHTTHEKKKREFRCSPSHGDDTCRSSSSSTAHFHISWDRVSDFSHSFRWYLLLGEFMCLRFIRTRTFSFCSFGSFVLDVGSCFRSVCVCVPVCAPMCAIYRKYHIFFSFFFPFPFHIIFFIHISLFEIFFYRGSCFVVKHITFNRTLCSVCVFVRAEWAKCFCAQWRRVSKIDFDIAFCPRRPTFVFRVSTNSIKRNFRFFSCNFRHIWRTGRADVWCSCCSPHSTHRFQFNRLVFYWIRSSHRNKNEIENAFPGILCVYRFVGIAHSLGKCIPTSVRHVQCVPHEQKKGFRSSLAKWHIISGYWVLIWAIEAQRCKCLDPFFVLSFTESVANGRRTRNTIKLISHISVAAQPSHKFFVSNRHIGKWLRWNAAIHTSRQGLARFAEQTKPKSKEIRR